MWGKLQLFGLVMSFILYLVDLGSDVYVAIQHRINGDFVFFNITIGFIALSLFLVNIYATTVIDARWYVLVFAFLFQFSMVYLFISEICRWRKENVSTKTRSCGSEHFSKCDCNECKEQLNESVQAHLNMSHVRSMETFCEAVPQWLLQVYVMLYKESYPWYTIVSVAISFVSLLFGIYSLEKNYWIRKIVETRDHVKPVSFPKRSAVVFGLWQAFLLLGRLSAIILNVIVFSGSIGFIVFWHWIFVLIPLVYSVTQWDGCGNFCQKYLVMLMVSLLIIYPLLFHVSHSSVACLKKFLPEIDHIPARFQTVALILVPLLFFLFHCIGGIVAHFLLSVTNELVLRVYIAIGSLYVLAFFYEAIYYSTCHPLKVTENNWKKANAHSG